MEMDLFVLSSVLGKVLIYFCFLLVGTIVTAITPLITLHIIDDAILSRNQTELYSLIMLYVGLMILNGIVSYISQYGMNKIGQVVVLEVRKSFSVNYRKCLWHTLIKNSPGTFYLS